jgi:ParB/RepB/Spo0J family partition protein
MLMRAGRWHGPLGHVTWNGQAPKWTLIDGAHRLASAREAGWTEAQFVVVETTSRTEHAQLRLQENFLRRENIAAAYKDIARLHAAGMSYTDIARETGITRSQIAKIMRLGSLSDDLFNLLEIEEISPNAAIEAATLSDVKQARALEMYRAECKLTVAQIRQLRNVSADAETLQRIEAARVSGVIAALETPEAEVAIPHPAPSISALAVLREAVRLVDEIRETQGDDSNDALRTALRTADLKDALIDLIERHRYIVAMSLQDAA